MKTNVTKVILVILITVFANGYSATVDTLYQVCTWKGNTDAAVSYTFDDNLQNQYSTAIPMFNQFGFHATFYPVINWSPNWSVLKTAADNGHEIGSHTISHANLGNISDSLQRVEFQNSKATINTNITGHQCLTIAYPFCAPGKDTITDNYYIAARHCQGVIEKSTPDNFYAISSIVCGSEGSVKTAADFKTRVTTAATSKGWVVYLIHALDAEAGYSPLSSAILRESLEYLDYKRDKYWVASFVNVVQYIRERNCASVEEITANNDTIQVQVTDTLDNNIYNTPITILRELPTDWEYATAFQDGLAVETSVKLVNNVKYIAFDALPDGGMVTIIPSAIPKARPTVDGPYELGTWKEFTSAAVTYTFDDNCSNQYSKAIPMLNEFGFKGTFYPVINWSPNWSSFKAAADNKHEIGSHTMSHPHLGEISDTLQNEELANSQSTINTQITGQVCRTIAYPYCEPSDDTITGKYYIAARHCQGYIEKTTPDDFFQISSIICGENGTVKTATDFQDTVKLAAKNNGWVVYLIHGMDGDGGYSNLSSSEFHQSLEYLDANRDTFWVSNFVNVARYIKERNSVSLKVLEVYTDSIQIDVADTLDNEIYDIPVSFRRTLLTGWTNAIALQNGDTIESRIRTISAKKYIEFDAIPDAGIVTIKKAAIPQVNPVTNYKQKPDIKVLPNPFSNELLVKTDGFYSYYIHTLDGRMIEHGQLYNSKNIGQNLSAGIYILNLSSSTNTYTIKIVKK